MKEVEITSRRVSVGGKMYGKGGKYQFTDQEASLIVRNGDGRVTQDLGKDEGFVEQAVSGKLDKDSLLNLINENRHEILGILEFASQERMAKYDEDMKNLEQNLGQKENADNSDSKDASQTGLGNDQADTSDAGEGTGADADTDEGGGKDDSASNTEPPSEADDSEAAPSGTPLPEHFPAKDKLEAAGFKTIESIPRDKDKLTDAGLSARSANAVEVRLVEIFGE